LDTFHSKFLELHPDRLAVNHVGFRFELSPHIVNLVGNIFVIVRNLANPGKVVKITSHTDPP